MRWRLWAISGLSNWNVRDSGRAMGVTFDDGSAYELSAEMLRVMSPSAEAGLPACGAENSSAARDVAIADATAVGNYAVKLHFNDGHSSGIFTCLSSELGRERDQRWTHI